MNDRFEAALDYLVALARESVSAKDAGKVREAEADVRAWAGKLEKCEGAIHVLPHKGCVLQ